MDLIIGTATFGTDYGIANMGVLLNEIDALEILYEAQNLGISSLDTAPAYSTAEKIIGKFHSAHTKFECYSKISSKMLHSAADLRASLKKSMELMEIDSLKGLLFHNPTDLLAREPEQIEALIDSINESGKVEKVGASVYELNEIIAIRERHPRISLFQVPENLGDQRLRHSQEIKNFHQDGIEFHVRSVFLQGLLMMKAAPKNLANVQPFLDKLSSVAEERNCSMLELCMNYVMQLEWASKLVVGAANTGQLREIIEATNSPRADLDLDLDALLPDDIRDPRRWTYA
jgi:aryl-alcohol dehydrogenase-like predicted oxidoreductase